MVITINMRVFKTIFTSVLIFSSLQLVSAGPASFLRLEHRTSDDDSPSLPLDSIELSEAPSSMTTSAPVHQEDTYDQRQNGTENYRIHVDGLVLVVAPVEGLLLAGGIPGASNDLFSGLGSADQLKPEPKPEGIKPTVLKPIAEEKLSDSNEKIGQTMKKSRPNLRLVSLLAPLLRRMAPH